MSETPEKIVEQLDAIDGAVQELQKPVIEVMEAERHDFDLKEVSSWLERAQIAKKALAEIEAAMLEAVERERYKEEFVVLPSGSVLELGYKAGGGRKWNHDRIKSVLIEAVIDEHMDDDSGTLEAPVSQLISEVLDTAGISYWKTTELDRFDIDADDYSTKKPRKFSAKVHRND